MKKKDYPENIKSQTEAADIAGVSRMTLSQMYRRGNSNYCFFTPDGKVDISHPDWRTYLDDKSHKRLKVAEVRPGKKKKQIKIIEVKSEKKSGKNNSVRKDRVKSEVKSSKGKVVEEKKELKEGQWQREHALTGGYDPAGFYPTNPGQLKSLTDVTRMNLEMRVRLGDLIERNIVDTYIDKIAQGVKQFVDLGRSVSSQICQKLDRMGMEKEVEKITNEKVKKIIEQIQDICNKVRK